MAIWVKICGICRPEEGRTVERSGADALGLIFAPDSPRFVTVERAETILKSLPSTIAKVGVFVLPDWSGIKRTVDRLSLDIVQWHGGPLSEEEIDSLSEIGVPWIHAVRWSGIGTIDVSLRARWMLVEGRSDRAPGGTGLSWNYGRLSGISLPRPLILSGGLSPETVGDVLRGLDPVSPFGVDVSSGVESSPGTKDEKKIMEFVKNVRDYERQREGVSGVRRR